MLVRSTRIALRRRLHRYSYSTVVEEEVRKFNQVAEDWWSPTSTTGVGPLHQLNPVRVKYIRSHVIEHFGGCENDPLPLQHLRVADIGCGGGILSEALCRIGAQNLVSVDPGAENILAARKHAQLHAITRGIDYRNCTSDDLVADNEQFDVVCSLEVIEHVSDPKCFLQSLSRLVKPGGLLFVSTINRTLISAALAIGMAEYVLRMVPPGTHDWNKFLQPEQVVEWIRNERMIVCNISGITGNPLMGHWRIDKECTSVNYILCASKPQ